MSDWRRINEAIANCRTTPDPQTCLRNLFDETQDGQVAFCLGQEDKSRGNFHEAISGYRDAERLYPKIEYKNRARTAYERLQAREPHTGLTAGKFGEALYVVNCTKEKIWDANPNAGRFVPAQEAYGGSSVRSWLARMETHPVSHWLFLSAKYGFIEPDHPVSNYDVTFSDPTTGPISDCALIAQVACQARWQEKIQLGSFRRVIVVGSDVYLHKVRVAFAAVAGNVEKDHEKLENVNVQAAAPDGHGWHGRVRGAGG